jgi:phosphohistidine swiveling domain-containing protein
MKLDAMPAWNAPVYDELIACVKGLEKALGDMQDIEFTIQDGELFILQVRTGKRTPKAAVKIAMDLLSEKVIDAKAALKRVSARDFWMAAMPVIDPSFKDPPTFTGIPAVSGVVTGRAVSAASAHKCTEPYVLVGVETNPDDLKAMHKSVGVLTLTGGETAHAAVVCTSMNRACVVGLGLNHPNLSVEDLEGKVISIDGATGRVWMGEVPVVAPDACGELATFEALLWKTVKKAPLNYVPAKKVDVIVVDVSGDLKSMAIGRAADRVRRAAVVANKVEVLSELGAVEPMEWSFGTMMGTVDSKASDLLVQALSHLSASKTKRLVFTKKMENPAISLSNAVQLLLG